MEKEVIYEKGNECYEVAESLEEIFAKMLNASFEDESAELKEDIKVKIIIQSNTGVK